MGDGLERVSRQFPCEICKKPDYCTRLTRWHWCMRCKNDHPHESGGWLWPKDAEAMAKPIPPRAVRLPDEEYNRIWSPIAEQYRMKPWDDRLAKLSSELGVTRDSLLAINVGFAEDLQGVACYTFPELNPRGLVVGISRRLLNPNRDGKTKMAARGSRRGLSYARAWMGWGPEQGAILLPEGASDVAAAYSIGVSAIGRPSNQGGVAELATMLKSYQNRPIFVLGENDRKEPLYVQQKNPNHDPRCPCCLQCFPGRAGAYQTALALGIRLKRDIPVLMPPRASKDLRTWVQALGINLDNPSECYKVGQSLRNGSFL